MVTAPPAGGAGIAPAPAARSSAASSAKPGSANKVQSETDRMLQRAGTLPASSQQSQTDRTLAQTRNPPSQPPPPADQATDIQTITGPGRYSCPIHPASRPAAMWETNAQYSARRGRVYALSSGSPLNRTVNWVYEFMFNPKTIQMNTATNQNVTADAAFAKIAGFGISTQGISGLELMVDRQLEVNRVPQPGPLHPDLPLVQKYGTQYDLEYLFRVTNGDAETADQYNGGRTTADIGFLMPTICRFIFGPAFAFYGLITAVNIQHLLFNASMVPMVSTITLDVTRASGAFLSSGDPNGTTFNLNGVASNAGGDVTGATRYSGTSNGINTSSGVASKLGRLNR